MSMHKLLTATASLSFLIGATAWAADGPGLGKPITEADIAPWDISIMPDGTGLPAGNGTAAQGAPIFLNKCSACHGDKGAGGIGGFLNAGPPRASLDGGKSVANFWPYATTVFDFIRRAMPYDRPKSLTDQEVYQLTAYVLFLNKIIGENDTIDKNTLPKVKLPNAGNFIIRFPERI